LFGALGGVAIAALGLRRAYRSTVRFYHGETNSKTSVQAKPRQVQTGATTPAKAGRRFLELRLPAVPEQATALALATFRSMLRAPEVKMVWASSFLVPLIVGGSFLLRGPAKIPELMKPFIATGAVVFSVFLLVQFFANQFGLDRDGFRALILSPAGRRLILLGKNLACLPAGTVYFRLGAAATAHSCGRPLATFRFVSARCACGQPVLDSRTLPHPTRLNEADQNARPGDVTHGLVPSVFPNGDVTSVRAAGSRVAVAKGRLAKRSPSKPSSVRHAGRPDGVCLLAHARPAWPPAPTP
jgi:hypothetical protein